MLDCKLRAGFACQFTSRLPYRGLSYPRSPLPSILLKTRETISDQDGVHPLHLYGAGIYQPHMISPSNGHDFAPAAFGAYPTDADISPIPYAQQHMQQDHSEYFGARPSHELSEMPQFTPEYSAFEGYFYDQYAAPPMVNDETGAASAGIWMSHYDQSVMEYNMRHGLQHYHHIDPSAMDPHHSHSTHLFDGSMMGAAGQQFHQDLSGQTIADPNAFSPGPSSTKKSSKSKVGKKSGLTNTPGAASVTDTPGTQPRTAGQPTNIQSNGKMDRKTLKRLRNRVSASRCRIKKKEWISEMEDESNAILAENQNLLKQIGDLEKALSLARASAGAHYL